MCHGGWVSDVGMIGKNMSRTAKEVLATGGHTSARTCRFAKLMQAQLLGAFLRRSIHLRNGNSKKPASASLFCASLQRPAQSTAPYFSATGTAVRMLGYLFEDADVDDRAEQD